MASTRFIRASGLATVAFGALVTASAAVNLATRDPALAAWPALIGTIAGLIGLTGLYLSRANELTRWGPVAFALAVTGLALSVGQFYGLTFSPPRTGPLGPLFPLGYGPFLYGFLAFAVLVLITGRLPRAAALLLITGVALNAAGFAAPEVRLGGIIVFGMGIVWVAAATIRSPALSAAAVGRRISSEQLTEQAA